MEKFNIDQFKSVAVDGVHYKVLDDGTKIIQMDSEWGFSERITPPKEWYCTYKEFYLNGYLKRKGAIFIQGDFKAGEWIEGNEKGEITNKTNYDSLYNLTLDDVLTILEQNKIPFTREDRFNTIDRAIHKRKGRWYVEWRKTWDTDEVVEINDVDGKIIKRTDWDAPIRQ